MKIQVLLILYCFGFIKTDYWSERTAFITLENDQAIGSSIELTEKEKNANRILMYYKLQEQEKGFKDPGSFLPARHFFNSREEIEKSEVFKIIRKLPKGASLHSHSAAQASGDYIYNLTYLPNLYGCVNQSRLKFHFFKDNPDDKSCKWTLVSTMREQNSTFDEYLKTQLTIIVEDPEKVYPDINAVWNALRDTFSTVISLVRYKPVFKEYIYKVLQELLEDNVKYVEFREMLFSVYDLNGTAYIPVQVAGLFQETLAEFIHDYPDFQGGRLIYSPSRRVGNESVQNYLKILKELLEVYPDFVTGFDLVGQEELGKPLTDFVNQIQKVRDEYGIKLFLHAGETNWYGTSTDLNLVDAVLLNTTRIGHGFALAKHPKVMEVVKERNTAIEVCPISNQVLKLVEDFRNHPAVGLIARGYPVVICNDDPGFWGAKGLSYDWYIAFMGLASREMDLRFLKQLALNSLLYSSMRDAEKADAIAMWKCDWEKFIDAIVN